MSETITRIAVRATHKASGDVRILKADSDGDILIAGRWRDENDRPGIEEAIIQANGDATSQHSYELLEGTLSPVTLAKPLPAEPGYYALSVAPADALASRRTFALRGNKWSEVSVTPGWTAEAVEPEDLRALLDQFGWELVPLVKATA